MLLLLFYCLEWAQRRRVLRDCACLRLPSLWSSVTCLEVMGYCLCEGNS